MALPWLRKHLPSTSADVVGQEKAVARVVAFVKGYRKGQKPLLLHGPTGSGKTSTVHAVARELDLEIIEVNASDTRNKESINSLLGAALKQQSLFFKGKVILVDEADGLSGQQDRGGVQALLALIKDARFPVVITANDIASDKLKELKKNCETVEFAPLAAKDLVPLLRKIAKHEKIVCDEQSLLAIAHRAGGDARAAINDLQSLSGGGSITAADLDALGDREQKESLQNAMTRVFKTTNASVALPAFDNIDEDLDQLFLWIDENLPKEYSKPEDLARAYDALAEADRFFGRIRRWQYYRFQVYVYNLLSAGIALAKDEKYPGLHEYKRSSRLLSVWIANQRLARKKSIAEKVALLTHTSANRALQDTVPYLKAMYKDKGMASSLAGQLKLTPEEEEWLRT
jgi:replication factor C large subunit